MSRLQVGGLALVVDGLNTGKIVNLVEHFNSIDFDDGSTWDDCWLIESRELINVYYCAQPRVIIKSYALKPISDKQTQDEFKKEMELVK